MSPALRVIDPGPLCLVEDAGRRGYGHLGVPRAGAFDTRSWRLANRLVGNRESAAALECLGGGFHASALRHVTVAVAGATGEITVNGRVGSTCAVLHLEPGDVLGLRAPRAGIRYYVAVGGGIRAAGVLGSCSYDTLGGIGPPPLRPGDLLTSGPDRIVHPRVDHVPPASPGTTFEVWPGPDGDEPAITALTSRTWDLDPRSDRVGVRLRGSSLVSTVRSLPSKPMVLGAVQVPPNGLPIILGPDHPTTGGYPVIAVVSAASMCDVAQWSGGPRTFRRA